MKSLHEYELDNAKLVARRTERRRRSVRRLKQRVARILWEHRIPDDVEPRRWP